MQRGSLKVVKDRHGVKVWRLQWRENGRGRTRILGKYAAMSRAEADTERKKIVSPLNSKMAAGADLSAVSVRRYVENEYLTVKTRVWKASTSATTEQIIEAHVLQDLGDRALATITRKDLQALLDAKADTGLSFSVVAHVRWQLVAIFAMAKSDGLITLNPAESLVMPKCVRSVDKRTINVDSIQRGQLVLEIRERLIFRLAVCEGMRPGEIVGLQVGDLGADGMLHVQRRIYRGIADTPKSKKGRRLVPLTPKTRGVLDRWLELLRTPDPCAWLFPSESRNTPLSYANVYRRRIQPALATVGLGHVNFQILRRTWVTEVSQVERDPAVRAQIAGHSIDVHENEYRQVQPAALKRTAQKLGKRLQ